jgi:hypothetical protein
MPGEIIEGPEIVNWLHSHSYDETNNRDESYYADDWDASHLMKFTETIPSPKSLQSRDKFTDHFLKWLIILLEKIFFFYISNKT